MTHRRKVKIVCTLGPATHSAEQISRLIEEGMDVARLNFSHGTHAFHKGLISKIRKLANQKKRTIAIMQDLQGPKLRVGALPAAGMELVRGEKYLLYPEGSRPKILPKGIRVSHTLPLSAEIAAAICKDTLPDHRILFDDGKILSRVLSTHASEILVEIENGGRITSHKGMNLPDSPLTLSCLTEKDLEDLKFGLSQKVDAVALSFVRCAKDILELKALIAKDGTTSPLVVAKIERAEAIDVIESIIPVTDALLVARGDMAVEIGAERVPSVQKKLIQACNQAGIPVITATQMLESMVSAPTPTRAEANDVANAVFDGTDAVMLSAETASGQYPAETVATMVRIVLEAERNRDLYSRHQMVAPPHGSIVNSIEKSASMIADQVGAVAIACLTHSGMAARTLAKYRPHVPIVAIMDNPEVLRKLAFVWGIRGVLIPKIVATDDLFSMVEKVLVRSSWAKMEDLVVVTAGVPTLRRGTTNMVKVHRIGVISAREKK